MSTGPVPFVLQAIEALKVGDRRGGAVLLARDLASGGLSPDRCRTIARLAAEIGEIDLAIDASRQSVIPGDLERLLGHYAILATYGRADEALADIQRQGPRVAEHPAVIHFRGTIASEQGRFEEADELFRRALKSAPGALPIWFALAMNKRFEANDSDLAAMERLLPAVGQADPESQARFLYALGKAYDDLGEADQAFSFFERGAAIRARQEPYDPAHAQRVTGRTIDDFNAEALARLTPSRAESQRSLFVTGLPRSGTTLVQQLLAAHSAVSDGGEINLFRPALIPTVDYSLRGAMTYQSRAGLDDPWGEVARDYARFLDMRFHSPGRIVDKSLGQTILIGLLLHALPDARIVWMRRRPEDTALSCFRTFFTDIRWSWSLADIGHHFRMEDRLFAHWADLFPDRILPVQYEELVKAPDEHIPSILDHFGLGHEAGLTNFHLNRSNIRTASVQQVRSPVSTAAIGRADPYVAHLSAFRAAYEG